VYDQGSRVTSPSFALFFAARPSGPDGPRAGFTTPRALGKSVVRNRIRRKLREAVRHELPRASKPVDYVFHPRRSVLEASLPQLRREVERILRKCETAVAAQ
jgi:ribonuclease P protein component